MVDATRKKKKLGIPYEILVAKPTSEQPVW